MACQRIREVSPEFGQASSVFVLAGDLSGRGLICWLSKGGVASVTDGANVTFLVPSLRHTVRVHRTKRFKILAETRFDRE